MMRQEDIIQWAQERHIFDSATPDSQHGKTLEEVQELTDALAANDEAEIKDAIGDIVVTLILQAHMHGWSLEECVEAAYQEIKDRKGRMVDGVFVKEGGMNRDELLTKLAMELAEWPVTVEMASEADAIMPDEYWMIRNAARRQYVASKGGIPGIFVTRDDWLQRRAELINKPSWDDAPEWAQWLAQENHGEWFWHEREPALGGRDSWVMDCPNGERQVSASDGAVPCGHDWRQTLEGRPTESKESGVIYAINTRTKEHIRVPYFTIIPPSSDHKLVHADADGWIPWDGGACPLPDGSAFVYRLRSGETHDGLWATRWRHDNMSTDIVAYRPILDESSETEAENRTPESAAVATLERLGFRYCGGMEWKPPIGPSRSFEADGDYFVFGDAESVEWDGEGLPPVGCECEYDDCQRGWVRTRVLAHHPGGSCAWHESVEGDGFSDYTSYSTDSAGAFRPIRSEEDRAVGAMLEVVHGNGHLSETGARALYRAGCRMSGGEE